MAYDCYVAICQPLLYSQVVSKQRYVLLVWGSWSLGILNTLINVPLAAKMGFCDTHIIPHYSCELPSLFLLSCSDVSTNLIVMFWSLIPHGLVTSLSIFFSYACIVSSILSITSTSGRSKAFSMCSSHLTTVILFYASGFLRYFTPTSGSSLELVFSVLYSVVIPRRNPLIYSWRTKEVQTALQRTSGKYLQCF